MGDWSSGHACQFLKKTLDYNRVPKEMKKALTHSDKWLIEYTNAIDKVCDDVEECHKIKNELVEQHVILTGLLVKYGNPKQ